MVFIYLRILTIFILSIAIACTFFLISHDIGVIKAGHLILREVSIGQNIRHPWFQMTQRLHSDYSVPSIRRSLAKLPEVCRLTKIIFVKIQIIATNWEKKLYLKISKKYIMVKNEYYGKLVQSSFCNTKVNISYKQNSMSDLLKTLMVEGRANNNLITTVPITWKIQHQRKFVHHWTVGMELLWLFKNESLM